MKILMASLLLIVPFLLTASQVFVKTPPKLKTFILQNIGPDNFFQGTNKEAKSIEIHKNKDTVYYPFDLYKSVSMTIGAPFDTGHTAHDFLENNQSFSLTLRLETNHNSLTNMNYSTVIFTFIRK